MLLAKFEALYVFRRPIPKASENPKSAMRISKSDKRLWTRMASRLLQIKIRDARKKSKRFKKQLIRGMLLEGKRSKMSV